MIAFRELVTKLRYSYSQRDRQRLNRYDRDRQKVTRGNRRLAAANTSLAASNARLGASFGGISRGFAGIGAALGVAFTGKAISDAGNALDDLENRIRAIEGADAPIRAIRRELTELSQANFANLDDTTQIFQRFRIGTEDLGKSRQEIIRFTDLVQKAGITSGASAQETNAALIQFAQGISSNRFSGEEFRSVAEQLPTILRVLKADLGLTTGQLREAAFAGDLTADVIFGAFDRQEDEIIKAFQQLELTRGLGTAQLKSGFTTFFGAFAQGSRFNEDIAQLNSTLGRFFSDNENAARRWGRATVGAFTLIGDSFGAIFGGSGAGAGIGAVFARIGEGFNTAQRFLNVYGALRAGGSASGKAFDTTIQTLFGEDAVARYRKLLGALKPIGQSLALIFGSRAVLGFARAIGGLVLRFGPLGAAVTVLSVGFAAWNKEGSQLRKLWERLVALWDTDFGTLMKRLGNIVGVVLVKGFEALVFLVDRLAAAINYLLDLGSDFVNSEFVSTITQTAGNIGQFVGDSTAFVIGNASDEQKSRLGAQAASALANTLPVRTLSSGAIVAGRVSAGLNSIANDNRSATVQQTLNFNGPANEQSVGRAALEGVNQALRPMASGAN